MSEKLRKFLAFEWLMFVLMGLFWASAVALPLYLSRAFKTNLSKSLLIMAGPYLIYVAVRLLWLIGRSVVWAYLTSNFFFTSTKEKSLAEEWMRFVFFGILWMLIMVLPMYAAGLFSGWEKIPLDAAILFGPYLLYLLSKMILGFFKSINWAVGEVRRK